MGHAIQKLWHFTTDPFNLSDKVAPKPTKVAIEAPPEPKQAKQLMPQQMSADADTLTEDAGVAFGSSDPRTRGRRFKRKQALGTGVAGSLMPTDTGVKV